MARSAPGATRDGWSDWYLLPLPRPLPAAVLAEILDGGQAFRWNRLGDGWLGCFGPHAVRLRQQPDGCVVWSAPRQQVAALTTALARYFDLPRDAGELADQLPWRSDPHLAECLRAFPGLRILRQPFGETLLGFLCSATKQIVQIKQMLALLAERHGARIVGPDAAGAVPGSTSRVPSCDEAGPTVGGQQTVAGATSVTGARLPPLNAQPGSSAPDPKSQSSRQVCPATFHALPTWPELARVSEADLRRCLLGFRARYIHETARFLAAHPGWLEATEALPYAEAKLRLCTLPGVGDKVADCVLLFGAGRLEAFPVDVWILKTMANRYGLRGWKPSQIAQFGRVHFGPLAGLAQQYLFAYERQQARLARGGAA